MEKKTQEHPWQSAPIDLMKAAIEHLNRNTTADIHIAFLLTEIGVEMLLKTYLTLPVDEKEFATSFERRGYVVKRDFYQLLEGVKRSAGRKMNGIDLRHIKHFHRLRNKLYHEGNGITISQKTSDDYVRIAVRLLKALLDVDLAAEMQTPKQIEEFRDRQKKELSQKKNQVHTALEELDLNIKQAIEIIEPKLLLPSFIRRLSSIMESYQVEISIPDDFWFILTQDPQDRLELTKELDLLIDSTIRDSKTKTRNLVRSSFISVLNECGIDLPTLEMLYYEIVQRVVRIKGDNLWGMPFLARLYPDSHPSEGPEMSEEEYWNIAIDEGDRLTSDIKKLATAIKDWVEKSQSPA